MEHINQQTKGVSSSNRIWRRISNLSAPNSNRRGLINAEDIGYIKLRKTAMDMLKWNRDETQFIHSGRLNFAPLNEFLIKQKMKPLRYMAAHALLVVLGRPNWKYRPDLVKSNLDSKLMTPTPGGNGIKEAALLLFREKNGRFIACREPLFLSNCVLSSDCSQFNSECPINQPSHHTSASSSQPSSSAGSAGAPTGATVATASSLSSVKTNSGQSAPPNGVGGSSGGNCNINRVATNSSTSSNSSSGSGCGSGDNRKDSGAFEPTRPQNQTNSSHPEVAAANSNERPPAQSSNQHQAIDSSGPSRSLNLKSSLELSSTTTISSSGASCCGEQRSNSINGDTVSMSSLRSLPEERMNGMSATANSSCCSSPPPQQYTARSYSLASALPRSTIIAGQIHYHHHNRHHHNHHEQQHQPAAAASSSCSSGSSPPKTVVSTTSTSTATAAVAPSPQPPAASSTLASGGGGATNHQSSNGNETHYNYYFHNHHQPYGDYEESFEIHERLSKESMLLRADTALKTRYWLQMLRYHAKDLGQWRSRRSGLANIMMMRQE